MIANSTKETQKTEQKSTSPESVKPGINDSFLDPEMDVDDFVARFEVESREVFTNRGKIVDSLKIKSGVTVADLGAGTGAFVDVLLEAVGVDGKLIAVDISPAMIEHLNERKKSESLKNMEVQRCGERDCQISPNSVDLIFTCDVYHHFEYPAETLSSIYKALKAGGEFVVVDFERIKGKSSEWTMNHVRAGKEVVKQEVLGAGFRLIEEVDNDFLEDNYILRFKR